MWFCLHVGTYKYCDENGKRTFANWNGKTNTVLKQVSGPNFFSNAFEVTRGQRVEIVRNGNESFHFKSCLGKIDDATAMVSKRNRISVEEITSR
jgi:hypothetical protein